MLKKISGLCTFVILSSAAYAATDTAVPKTTNIDQSSINLDQKILNSAHDIIQNQFRKYNVTVTSHDGNVTLKGYVDDGSTMKAIEAEVRKINGVKSINNMLKIKPSKA